MAATDPTRSIPFRRPKRAPGLPRGRRACWLCFREVTPGVVLCNFHLWRVGPIIARRVARLGPRRSHPGQTFRTDVERLLMAAGY